MFSLEILEVQVLHSFKLQLWYLSWLPALEVFVFAVGGAHSSLRQDLLQKIFLRNNRHMWHRSFFDLCFDMRAIWFNWRTKHTPLSLNMSFLMNLFDLRTPPWWLNSHKRSVRQTTFSSYALQVHSSFWVNWKSELQCWTRLQKKTELA